MGRSLAFHAHTYLYLIYLERVESDEVINFPQNQIKVSPMNS